MPGVPDELPGSIGFRPEDDPVFRMTQLLLVLCEVRDALPAERLLYVDFLATYPFLVLGASDPGRARLLLMGFEIDVLGYQSPAHLFLTRRQRLNSDVATLVSYGLVQARVDGTRLVYACSGLGRESCESLTSLYPQAVRESAKVVSRIVSRMSDRALVRASESWITTERTGPILWLHDEAAEGLSEHGSESEGEE